MEQWIRVADLTGKGIYVGISKDGCWVREWHGQIVKLTSLSLQGSPFMGLLPWLEKPLGEVKSVMRNGLEAVGLPISLTETFPYEGIVQMALFFQSDYWVRLALDWLTQIPLTEEIVTLLTEVQNTKRVSQHDRQRANRLVKEWRKGVNHGRSE
jgi:hypothetical protein